MSIDDVALPPMRTHLSLRAARLRLENADVGSENEMGLHALFDDITDGNAPNLGSVDPSPSYEVPAGRSLTLFILLDRTGRTS